MQLLTPLELDPISDNSNGYDADLDLLNKTYKLSRALDKHFLLAANKFETISGSLASRTKTVADYRQALEDAESIFREVSTKHPASINTLTNVVSGAFFNKDYVEKYWLNFIDDLAKRDYFVETLEWKGWVQALEVITKQLPDAILLWHLQHELSESDMDILRTKIGFLDNVLDAAHAMEVVGLGERRFHLGKEINSLM